jgi:hypothetical protein
VPRFITFPKCSAPVCSCILKATIADLFTLFSSSVQNSEGGGEGDSGNSFADPCQEFKQGFWGFLVVSPLVNHYQGYV